ncbi:hypothetical protein GCK32_008667 [Trichostrongylus colubriformis]|uniref:Uncharacterized protein n=1 Tax=Trichostrongylus colubriformis TaxID=6319 RepID=A0AAN8G3R9_TRICO
MPLYEWTREKGEDTTMQQASSLLQRLKAIDISGRRRRAMHPEGVTEKKSSSRHRTEALPAGHIALAAVAEEYRISQSSIPFSMSGFILELYANRYLFIAGRTSISEK